MLNNSAGSPPKKKKKSIKNEKKKKQENKISHIFTGKILKIQKNHAFNNFHQFSPISTQNCQNSIDNERPNSLIFAQ